MIDLGCHPMYLSSLFLGMPESVTASYGYVTGREVEDNAVVTLNYANGSIGIVEAGFVNRFSPFTIEIHELREASFMAHRKSIYSFASPSFPLEARIGRIWQRGFRRIAH